MDEFDDSGNDSGTVDLISALGQAAASSFNTYEVANANPLNAALITGGSATTAQGSTTGVVSSLGGSTGLVILGIAALVAFFALMVRR
jgi:hypothetical protein